MTDKEMMLAKRVLVRVVAKAICKSRSCEGIACCQWPCNGGRHGEWHRTRRECPVELGGYDNAALDAIVAYQKALGIAEEDGCDSRAAARSHLTLTQGPDMTDDIKSAVDIPSLVKQLQDEVAVCEKEGWDHTAAFLKSAADTIGDLYERQQELVTLGFERAEQLSALASRVEKIEAETVERCAKVAEVKGEEVADRNADRYWQSQRIARSIRALSQPKE